MTWEEMQLEASLATLDEVAEMEKEILRQYKVALENIDKLVKDQYAKLAGVAPEDYYNETLKYNRLTKLQAEISAAYIEAAKRAGKITGQASELAMSNAYYRSMYVASWLEDYPEISVGALPVPLIDVTVYSRDATWAALEKRIKFNIQEKFGGLADYYSKGGTLSELLAKNLKADLQKIADQITIGLTQGQSYDVMMKNIAKIIGEAVKQDGKVTLSGAMANALRIVRTETTRTLNAGSHAADMDLLNQGVLIQKQWMATLDTRTRDSHAALDGQRRDVDKEFSNGLMYPSEPNCRCTTITIVDGVGPSLRRGRDPVSGKNEIMTYKSFEEWSKEKGLTTNKYGKMYKFE